MVNRLPAEALLDKANREPVWFDRGVNFGKNQAAVFGGVPDDVVIDPASGAKAELWVIDPSEFDDTRHVVVADERTARRESFFRWLRYDAQMPQDDAPPLIVYVPERAPGRDDAARRLREQDSCPDVVSYYPPFVWQ